MKKYSGGDLFPPGDHSKKKITKSSSPMTACKYLCERNKRLKGSVLHNLKNGVR
jgi:hypothetical protein